MNILGIVVEYNPFHYGHQYHLQASKERTKADVTIAVMSGSFLQRGEPALVNKWTRTKMALKGGVDLVIELPYIYATQKAEIFSDGAISLLDALGVNCLCFGSESGDINRFQSTVTNVKKQEQELNKLVKESIKTGVSYPKAFSTAYQTLFNTSDSATLDLGMPNNILGYQYVKSVRKINSQMKVETVIREKAHYHDTEIISDQKIASATAIRKEMFYNLEKVHSIHPIEPYVPPVTYTLLQKNDLSQWEHYFPYLRYKLLTTPHNELENIYECEEGMEYRLLKMIKHATSFHSFMELVKSKRYTWTRIQRLLVHILMNTTKEFMQEYCRPLSPSYIRILGMSQEGRSYLSSIKKTVSIPLVTKASEYQSPILEKDTVASHVHRLPFSKSHTLLDEFKAIPIQYDKKEDTFR